MQIMVNEDWLLETLYHANRNDNDTYRVFLTLRRYIYDTRDFTGILEQITPDSLRIKPTTDLADDCLFSVCMFSPYISRRRQRRGAPGRRFYNRVGRSAFIGIGFPGIARNWDNWVSYVQEHVVI